MTDHVYHAFARLKNADSFRILAVDLSERELRRRVVKPYKGGKDIFLQSTITSIDDIESLKIVRSASSCKDELKRLAAEHQAKIDHENRQSGIKIISRGRGHSPLELLEASEDVTSHYISTAPGSGTIATKAYAFFHNQWVTGIGLLIIGILVGKLWGKGA
jgi:hypothetical protein